MTFRTTALVTIALASASSAWSQASGSSVPEARADIVSTGGALAVPAKPVEILTWAAAIQKAYPAEARRAGLAGQVFLAVTVTPEGRTIDCEIRVSSGHPILDEAACSGMLEHARFTPALDAEVNPVPSRYSMKITYVAN